MKTSTLESFATHYTGETRVALWCAVVAVASATLWMMAPRVRRSPRPWLWVLVGTTVVFVAVAVALFVPFYLESIDVEPL